MADFTERRLARMGSGELFAPAYTDPVPSPDGSLLAWISDRDGRPRAWLARLPEDGSPVVEPEKPVVDDADVQALSWSPDGLWLALQLAPGGGERTIIRVVAPDGSDVRNLAPGAAAATLGAWSPSGHLLGVTVFPEGAGDGQACLLDLRDGTSTVLAAGPAARVCAVSGDGRRAVVRLGRRGARGLELVDLRSGRRTELIPGAEATVADARFGVTGGQLYVHTDAGRDRPALLAVTLRGMSGVSTVFTIAERPDDDLDIVALDPAGARAALVWNVDGRSETELLDLRSGLLEPLVQPLGEVVTGAAFTRDGRALLVAGEGPTITPRIGRIELDGYADHTPLLPAEPADDEALVAPTLHDFRAEDGLRLSGWLFRPRGGLGALPTMLWLHGGPEAQERPTYQPLFQALLAAGVAVFAPNVRGSGGYGREFASADDHERRFVAITDVRAAVDFLTSSGLADPGRIGVSGRSYGGYLTLAALARFPELFAVGVDVCGMSDFATFYAHTEPWIAEAATSKYGDPHADATLLRELSPIHQADRIVAPLLVVHGGNDTNVPLVEAEQIVEALRERGASPGYLLFPDEGHEVRGTENRAVFVREVVSWVSARLTEPAEQTA
ncbi:S9 family peptidase [Pseudonocardia sp.]|uniref:S9 family peptidase n=1 Tax=Pseudonocardia sp. TaxID=60912 RepID=UPI002613A52E|nr:S9 family peptidase [Pseudonocardia sp.]MCW2717939.1 putative acylaminoacyl-peptidase [Pseudonocardia sp.]